MRLIHELLSRYAHIAPPDAAVRKRLSKIISTTVGTPVSERNIRIIGPVAYCTLPSLVKNMVFLQKGDILNKLKDELGKETIHDIQ